MNNTQKVIKYLVTFLALILIFFIVYIPFMFISSAINGIHKVLFATIPNDLIMENAELDNLDFSKISIDVSSRDRKSTRLNSSHVSISYAVFCLKKKKTKQKKKIGRAPSIFSPDILSE